MLNDQVTAQLAKKPGFIAALDQSGGSTPGALKAYGIAETAYSGEDEMYKLVHAMRVRIIGAPAFTGNKVIAAILFERTMDGEAHGKPVPTYLWKDRSVVPLLKVDKGLANEQDGVQVMKPIPGLDDLLARAIKLGVYGTKMRSVIKLASRAGIGAVVDQQFEIAAQIAKHGLIPIIEPEVSIKSSDKADSEAILLAEIQKHLDADPDGFKVILKLTIPDEANLYAPLSKHGRVVRVVAL
jgi:fructose-bisphosphate aldolase, class I